MAPDAIDLAAAGRPREIEEATNRYIVHPLSRRIARIALARGISPDALSIAGAGLAGIAALVFVIAPWPANALVGFALLVATHVFDGADGLVARASKRASLRGASIDGFCDAFTLVVTYVALTILSFDSAGLWIAPLVAVAVASNIVHANGYEGRRGVYMHWVHGKPWLAYTTSAGNTDAGRGSDNAITLLQRLFAAYYARTAYETPALRARMTELVAAGGATAAEARVLYARYRQPVVRAFSLLGQNHKTLAIGAFTLAAMPASFFVYVVTVLNVLLILFVLYQRRQDAALMTALDRIER